MVIRKPAVAGTFYPSDSSELRKFSETYLRFAANPRAAKAVILPHAGYIYSGETACRTLSPIRVPQKNFLIGPNHRGIGSDFSLFPKGEWETPLGSVAVDEELAAAMLEASHDLRVDEAAHRTEHSLEVLVPLLQTKNPALTMVPLLVGTLNLEDAHELALVLGEILASRSEPILVVVSNDMSHYEDEVATREKDRYALRAIENLDAEGLKRVVREHRITMCGYVPVYMLLIMSEALGIKKATLVDYRTSADATGDRGRVVGYAGFIFE